MKENEKIKNLTLYVNADKILSEDDLKGKKSIIYFYPKDDTPGCTKEAINFTEYLDNFKQLNTQIFGVSKDSEEKHNKFIKKYNLKVDLVSDKEGKLCEQFNVWVEKSMYGKKYMGIERSTFLLNEDLTIKKIWRKVKVPGHALEVLNYLKNI